MKKTPWFSAATPPVHEGPYECKYNGSKVVSMRFFRNRRWYVNLEKQMYLSSFGMFPGDKWRGLTEHAKDQT